VALSEDPEAKARLAVSRASTVEMLDALRTLVDRRHGEGVFSDAQKAALVDLIHHKAEMLLADEEKGQEFEHEAAGTEVHL
jgi:DNA-binding FadR family transcriptional regulator